MFSEPLDLGKVDAGKLIDYLYQFFHRDFVVNKTFLNNSIYINPESNRKDDDKENSFWHLTTRDHKINVKEGNRYVLKIERLTDFARSARIEWVKQIIDNYSSTNVKCFYHKETTGGKPIRLYLWAHQNDFVVILQKLGRSSSFLVTSFYVDQESKRKTYQQRYEVYKNKNTFELAGCEWF